MRISGIYVGSSDIEYTYVIDVHQSFGQWAIEGTVRHGGRVVALPYDTLPDRHASTDDVEALVHGWIARYIDSRFPDGGDDLSLTVMAAPAIARRS
ncbi:MAG: hypothetical protein KIT73_10450 [Burkholderiales bacterium]|nr:hypothetical protein [Burkholderiales bacterium]